MTVSSVSRMKPTKPVEYIECNIDFALLNTEGRPAFLHAFQIVAIPNYYEKTLIPELEIHEANWTGDERFHYLSDNGELLKEQTDLYKMLLLCQREVDQDSVKSEIITLLARHKCEEPEDGVPEVWAFIDDEATETGQIITWNDVLSFFYMQPKELVEIYKTHREKIAPLVAEERFSPNKMLLNPRFPQISLDDIIEQFGETLYIEGQFQPLIDHMTGDIEHTDEPAHPDSRSSTPFSDAEETKRETGEVESKTELVAEG